MDLHYPSGQAQADGLWSARAPAATRGNAGEAHGDYSAGLRAYILLPRGVYVCYP